MRGLMCECAVVAADPFITFTFMNYYCISSPSSIASGRGGNNNVNSIVFTYVIAVVGHDRNLMVENLLDGL